jgi:hypothetical protein
MHLIHISPDTEIIYVTQATVRRRRRRKKQQQTQTH